MANTTKPMTFILKDQGTGHTIKHKLTSNSAMIVKDMTTTFPTIIKHEITDKTKIIVKNKTTGAIEAINLWRR